MGMDRQIEKKKWPPRKIAVVAGAAVFVLVVLYLFLFQFNESTLNVDTERITVSTVTKGPFLEFIPQQGTVTPINRYSLETTEGGRVEKRFLEAGAMVKAGDPIVELVNTNLLLDIMWREADFVQQSNSLRQTRLNMEQYRQGLRQQMNQVENELAKQKTTYERYLEAPREPARLRPRVRADPAGLTNTRSATATSWPRARRRSLNTVRSRSTPSRTSSAAWRSTSRRPSASSTTSSSGPPSPGSCRCSTPRSVPSRIPGRTSARSTTLTPTASGPSSTSTTSPASRQG